MSGAEGERQIKTNFALSPVLLVLDNADTFEDAVDRVAATRISDFIAHIANTCEVTVILTSRTNSSARRVDWTQFDVPPLAREPARQSFRKIYPGEINDNEIDRLLAAVDFHPLSISILAHAAKENRWSGNVLLERWESQRGEILQTGDGKDNLGFTVRLSLESPSVMALGNGALHGLKLLRTTSPAYSHQSLIHHLSWIRSPGSRLFIPAARS
ncbi:hypothetical protein JVU11DRAFT_10596 [Chiua virens]|nr:hypothetical protein JVU11DRAFT_10596 [Chiua virens]